MLDMRVRYDDRQARRFLGALERETPFAISVGINRTAEDAQRVQQQQMQRAFMVRNPRFIPRAVKIKPFAKKRSLKATIQIDPPGTNDDLLTRFERGGTKRAQQGRPWVAIPLPAVRRTKTGKISKSMSLESFKPFVDQPGRVVGQRGTFIVQRGSARLLMQRVGRRGRLRALYLFVRSVRLPPILDFYDTVGRVVRDRFEENVVNALRETIRRAHR